MTPPADPPRFDEPWHAQLFALTVALSEAGHFTWPDWTEALGASLARHRRGGPLDGGDDYFAAWLDALEGLLDGQDLVAAEEAGRVRELWRQAYLDTPHGEPVRLPG